MKISLHWLKDYIDLKDIPEKELLERLTLSTCEVEGVHRLDEHNRNTVIGQVIKIDVHPSADRLKICTVDIGDVKFKIQNPKSKINSKSQIQNSKNYQLPTTNYQPVQVVCGGTNLKAGAKVVVALPGASIKWHGQDEWTELKETEIRGVKSTGMICAAEELEIPWRHEPSEGEHPIMILPQEALVGESVVKYLGLDDVVLEIDNKSITHRADLFCHIGIASELGAIFKIPFKDIRYAEQNRHFDQATKERAEKSPPAPMLRRAGHAVRNRSMMRSLSVANAPLEMTDWEGLKKNREISVEIQAKEAVHRSSFLLLKGLRVQPSPLWMQNRLYAIGQRPINNIVDVTNYVMWEVGTPLHAFDVSKIRGSKMIVRFGKDGEKVTTLDKVERMVDATMLLGEDGEGRIIDLPGIMGGALSEVDQHTTSILLQSAAFDRVVIRKSTLKLAHRTDGAAFHERASDPHLTVGALIRSLELLKETCPDIEVSQVIDWYPKPSMSRVMVFDSEMIRKQLGINIPMKESKEILERLGFGIRDSSGRGVLQYAPTEKDGYRNWTITIPPRRKDIHGFQDICEEVGRIFGYDRVEPLEHVAPLRSPETPKVIQTREFLRDTLYSRGFNELYNYIFWSERDTKFLNIPQDSLILVQNPISQDLKYLRTSLLPGFLHAIELNQARFERCSLFEVGKVFSHNAPPTPSQPLRGGEGVIPFSEHERFACAIAGHESIEYLFRKMVGVWEESIRVLKLPQEYTHAPLSSLQVGAQDFVPLQETGRWLTTNEGIALCSVGKPVGVLGTVKRKILDAFGVKQNVVFCELDTETLSALQQTVWEYQTLSQFPSVFRDISLVAGNAVSYAQVAEVLSKAELLTRFELFDVFAGRGIPGGKKSLAFHLEFSAPDQTLESQEVDESLKKIFLRLEKDLGVILRS